MPSARMTRKKRVCPIWAFLRLEQRDDTSAKATPGQSSPRRAKFEGVLDQFVYGGCGGFKIQRVRAMALIHQAAERLEVFRLHRLGRFDGTLVLGDNMARSLEKTVGQATHGGDLRWV